MPPSTAVRSSAITLAIAIAIVVSQASGFTIHRTKNNNTLLKQESPSPDFSLDGSLQLQVKNDLIRNNIRENDGDSKVVALEHMQTSEEEAMTPRTTVNSNDAETDTITEVEITTAGEVSTEKSSKDNAVNVTQDIKNSLTQAVSETINTAEEDNMPATVLSYNEILNQPEVLDTATDSHVNHGSSVDRMDKSTTHVTSLRQNTTPRASQNLTVPKENINEHSSEESLTTAVDQISIDSKTLTELEKSISEPNNASKEISHTPETVIETKQEISSTVASQTNGQTTITVTPLTKATEKPTKSTEAYPKVFTSAWIEISNNNESSSTTSEPSWKKYTTIERRRVANSTEISQASKTNDDMKAETSKTHVSLETAFSEIPISSSEKIQADLLPNTYQFSPKDGISTELSQKSTTETKSTFSAMNSIGSSEGKRIEIVHSQRGGFLDFSGKSSTAVETTTLSMKKSENDKTADNVEAIDGSGLELNKKEIRVESQSQLDEDAIKEELMKEEMVNDKVRYQNGQKDSKGVEPLADFTSTEDKNTEFRSSQVTTTWPAEDVLSVHPITNERTRTTLYTVSPNYKPMKKIDVQPAKPFVRDPDDNSWRNESISSLGIVFKPKNSSVSFKEVLKNKSQIELNNLQEKEYKNDLPDLRVRLEKIAEVRKTKKKKMNKDGEEVYTDYEEGSNSAESTSTPKPETSTLISNESSTLTTSSPSSLAEVTPPMSRWKQMEEIYDKTTSALFKSLGIDPLTTRKPKKFYNIPEYYDTTDEYDADYVTLSKIDLKKFTVNTKTTDTPATSPTLRLQTKPMKTYHSDRKPTVQYFPPREPQKVNVNNYDQDFERKVNLFTLKDSPTPPQTQPSFVVIPPVQVTTNIPEIRSTVKPSDFTMYTPEDMSKNYYVTHPPHVSAPPNTFLINEESFNSGSYVIKHYKDFLGEAAKVDDEREPGFIPFTEPPRGVMNELATEKPKTTEDDYDYDQQFRKDVLSRFVDNFNQNSERFKVDFPVLYNNSIVHGKVDEQGKVVASSRTFLKRLYNNEGALTKPINLMMNKGCVPNCDNMTVELSPAYELHYYVPEEEEKEEMERRPAPLPYRYRL